MSIEKPSEGETKPEGESEQDLYFKAEAKEAFKERDKARAETRLLREQIEATQKKALEETNQFKKLYEDQTPLLEQLKKEKSELEAYKKADEEETNRILGEAEGKISEIFKMEYDLLKESLSPKKRISWINLRMQNIGEDKNSPAGDRPGGGNANGKGMPEKFEDRVKLAQTNPGLFKKLIQTQ